MRKPRPRNHRVDEAAVIERLEALYLIVVEADAYQHACKETFRRLSWQSDGHPDCRRDINRIDCYFEQTSETISRLLIESDAALKAAIGRSRPRKT
jgi:hypothetical protein